ncbi:hypothetical protein F0231_13800 [Vibrio sp. RE86]|uniref:TDP-N-acetylfucosamine:lipid II N-acetylfucosaminyltransferase n=1 Tax=Vibrio sp. RE86 TaxID=2607605 RepID=UPI00149377C5|nr:TDP-N-acetylfucosamine:lipid II N-acetylfucosaminyltransferase [Vibrio sp. RE86]NOH80819.1 hypothetical protein [Vibrio sp. RE86]
MLSAIGVRGLRILHLSSNNNNLYYALETFTKLAENHVYMLGEPTTNEYKDIITSIGFFDLLNPYFSQRFLDYDLVVLHSLSPYWIRHIILSNNDVKFLWIGWGWDYYDLVKKFDGLLPRTKSLHSQEFSRDIVIYFKNKLSALKVSILNIGKRKAISKISYFSPVIYEDYELIDNNSDVQLPPYVNWNYGGIEKWLHGGEFDKLSDWILLGNSATYSNNHFDIIDFIKKVKLEDRKVVVPLSYGERGVKKEVINHGSNVLNGNFKPINDYLPLDEYNNIISSCGFVIMNHVRQQAHGNIILMLYLGAKVFIREDCPSYLFFKRVGAVIFGVSELIRNPSLLDLGLTDEEKEINRFVIEENWSRRVIDEKGKEIIKVISST